MQALIILIDGGDPAYFEASPTPNLDRIANEGARFIVSCQMPSVTNVNNVSMICGAPPASHGITANYFLNTETGEEVYMESGDFVRAPTLMEMGRASGRKTAVLASKQKLCDMIGKGAESGRHRRRTTRVAHRKSGPQRGDIQRGRQPLASAGGARGAGSANAGPPLRHHHGLPAAQIRA